MHYSQNGQQKVSRLPDWPAVGPVRALLSALLLVFYCIGFELIYTFLNIYAGFPSLDSSVFVFLRTLLCTVLAVIIFFPLIKKSWRDFCRRPGRVLGWAGISYFIALGAAYAGLMFYTACTGSPDISSSNQQQVEAILKDAPVFTALSAAVLAPVCEELLFRAGIFRPLYDKNRFLAHAVTFLLFGLAHVWTAAVQGDPTQLLIIPMYGGIGWALAFVYRRTGNIFTAIFGHMLRNGLAILLSLSLERMEILQFIA